MLVLNCKFGECIFIEDFRLEIIDSQRAKITRNEYEEIIFIKGKIYVKNKPVYIELHNKGTERTKCVFTADSDIKILREKLL